MGMNVGTSSSDEPEVMIEMNTTPLIDVMLVLLIMLIITIPAQLHSENLDMPGKPIADRAELDLRLTEAVAMQPQPELHIRSHAKAKYEAVVAVMASAQRKGLTKLGILGSEQFVN